MQLSDYFIPLCAVVKGFNRAPEQSAEALAAQIDTLIQQAQTLALTQGVALDQFQQGLFPVLAWADEFISRHSHWATDHAWQKHLLQRRYFKTAMAGREFFERFDALPDDESSVREVFVLCLCLGFMGKYSITPNSGELASIRINQYKQLQRLRPGFASTDNDTLFPKAYDTQKASAVKGRFRRTRHITWQRVLCFALPPIIVLLVAWLLHTQLTHAVQTFRDAVNL
ncbi:DotU family type IV/VI secretion system protein [Alcaligenes endophyticus]|uniref:DotU family type IV/VI secretion system protein n=1 Tax=Alcaligenes endophyticus TaxID=1929088 RepID=A0ABT8EFR3_9BURK|nr:DotU family type IV/VI secretion system protein [Alcaligenes endophyticus]MCX5590239.1 DotU family type IV/VI secretion system protein [Alcaligenes endophyticus]MDN4120097.1 DotU family type IV/VI secretion system protein [Alcaligenes endophyticus]